MEPAHRSLPQSAPPVHRTVASSPAPLPAPQHAPEPERTLTNALRLLGRALRLRCPNCGKSPVLKSWGTVHQRCATCHFRFERSSDSYFTGAMFFNLIIAEFLFFVIFGATLILSWPNVDWDAVTYGAAGGMAITPIVLYPFSKVVYLSIDVFMRPVRPEECDPTNTNWTWLGV
jgi:uncharacterized protein (DUF983 family)